MGYSIRKYLKYKNASLSKNKIHSPFVFDFVTEVLLDKEEYYAYQVIHLMRKKLIANRGRIEVVDLGAGSKKGMLNSRKISDIAKYSVINEKFGKLLFRIVNHYDSEIIIELGTSLGISAAYMSKANSNTKIYTIEGSQTIANIAQQTFNNLKCNNVNLLKGNFDEALPLLLDRLPKVDLVYFDGNHRKEATLNYFKQCLTKATDKSIFIFDDIYWSDDMEEAWNEIRKNEKVTMSIDLFRMGIVFFGNQMPKQHFVLKF